MSEPTRRLTLSQFRMLLPDASVLTRRIDAVHLHHTWKPTRGDFRGVDTIEAMRRFHRDQGWIDIAQHLTIDPQGGLWTGRNWNLPPASVKGHNGTASAGPFMIEIVGDFDDGHDPFDGPQRDAAVAVVAHLLKTNRLRIADVKLHRELAGGAKTCPGSGFDRADFEASLTAEMAKKFAPLVGVFPREFLAGAGVSAAPAITVAGEEVSRAAVPEHAAAANVIDRDTRQRVALEQERYSRDFGRLLLDRSQVRGEDWTELKPHVVNLSRGELSESGGEFTTTPIDLDAIIDAIRDRTSADPALRILLYAHGGLVGEGDALTYAKAMYPWWLSKGIYPVFFVWETGILEILRQRLFGARDIWDWTSDAALELAAKGPGTLVWSEMKGNARRASEADLGEGYPGGAYLFANKLAAFLKSPGAGNVSLHAVGHSAGAIFHAHLLPALVGLGVPRIATLSLLAPAARTDLFAEKLLPLITTGKIAKHTCFTMEEEAEEQDDCWKIYRKSLLYFVSHSFEGVRRRPILGLHRSIRTDAILRDFYGIAEDGTKRSGGASNVEIQFSYARDKAENPLTRALRHGDFDNDARTMSAALRRILGVPDSTAAGEADFPFEPLRRTFETVPLRPAPIEVRLDEPSTPPGSGLDEAAGAEPLPDEREPSITGARRALCVGIDEYRDQPLEGCVNDANAWGRVLTGLGFTVTYLRNRQATNRRIQGALRDLIASSLPGDVLVFQYSGHGTQLADDNGDESDGFDEAFVPVDYHKGELLLRDDVIAEALESLPEGVTLTLFMDCCHCGTNSRFAPATRAVETATDRVRYLPPDLLGAARNYRRSRGRSRGLPSSAPGVIHLAACRDDEYAWESRGQGDFTGAATAFLADAVARGDTNEAFMKQVAKIVAARKRQHPLMLPPAKGMARRPILGGVLPARPAVLSADTADIDARLLEHLEAAVRLLRARVDARRTPSGE
jgi:hypothetical protein